MNLTPFFLIGLRRASDARKREAGRRACWSGASRSTKPAKDGRGSRRDACRAVRRKSVRLRSAAHSKRRDGGGSGHAGEANSVVEGLAYQPKLPRYLARLFILFDSNSRSYALG